MRVGRVQVEIIIDNAEALCGRRWGQHTVDLSDIEAFPSRPGEEGTHPDATSQGQLIVHFVAEAVREMRIRGGRNRAVALDRGKSCCQLPSVQARPQRWFQRRKSLP